MARTSLTFAEASTLLDSLVAMVISRPWKGYGSSIFLELGELTADGHRHGSRGQACIHIDWDWRVEDGIAILFGSSNDRPEIAVGLESICGLAVARIELLREIPELLIRLSDGKLLRSAAMVSGNPQWTIRLDERRWLAPESGSLYVGDGAAKPMSDVEVATSVHAQQTARRWITPTSPDRSIACMNCVNFVRLNGDFDLLDFGVCTAAESTYDGRIVKSTSGCPCFQSD